MTNMTYMTFMTLLTSVQRRKVKVAKGIKLLIVQVWKTGCYFAGWQRTF